MRPFDELALARAQLDLARHDAVEAAMDTDIHPEIAAELVLAVEVARDRLRRATLRTYH